MSTTNFKANESTALGATKLTSWVNTGDITEKIPANVPTNPDGTAHTQALTDTQLRASAVPVSISSTPLPTDAAKESKQDTGNASLASIDSKLSSPVSVTGPLTDTQLRAAAVPVSSASLPLPSGASTSANQTTANASLSSIDSKLTAPLSVTGPLTDTQLRASDVPVSAASLPLPSGASTAANQTTANASLSSIDSKLTSPLTVTGPLTDTELRASAVPVSAASLPLPSGAATSANQTTSNASLSSIDGKLGSLGQKLMAGSAPVVIASDQSALPVSQATASNLNAQVVGNVASAASDSGNPVKVGGVFNSTVPAFTNGQRGDFQIDADGSLITKNEETREQTYSASAINITVAATPTDVFTITGSASKTILIKSISFTANQTIPGWTNLILVRRSTANSGGTSTTQTNVALDTNNAASTATVRSYTANPTLGTLVGNLRSEKIAVGTPLLQTGGGNSGTSVNNNSFSWTAGERGQPIVLRGTSEVIALNLNSLTIAGSSCNMWIEWTEV